MRSFLPLLLVACGPSVPALCNDTGCPMGKTCNVNTGVCLATPDAGRGGGQGGAGGTGGGGGGGSSSAGGGAGGGGASATVRVQMHWDAFTCNASTCADCLLEPVIAPSVMGAAAVPFNTFTAWKTGRYAGCQFPPLSGEFYVIDCTGNCNAGTEQCTTPTGTVARKKFTCVYPDGVSGYVWTP